MEDENVLRRWFSLELGALLDTFVPNPRPLLELLREKTPVTRTRAGDSFAFEPATLKELSSRLPALTRAQVRLPFTIHIEHETPGDAYAADPATIDALRCLLPNPTSPRQGRLWLSTPLVRDLASRYPTAFQFVLH